jgi:hypothetical protein
MALRRGFKSEANWLARNVRDELGIASHLPLCPWRLAELLGFPVISISEFAESEPDAVIYLDRQEDNAISPPSRCSMAVPASSFTTMVIS